MSHEPPECLSINTDETNKRQRIVYKYCNGTNITIKSLNIIMHTFHS